MYHGDSQYNGGAEGGSATQSQQQQYNGQIQQQTGLSYQPQVAMPPIRRFSTEADIHHAAPLQLDDQPPSTYREENPTERGYREEQQGLNTALPPYRAPPHLYHPRDRLGREALNIIILRFLLRGFRDFIFLFWNTRQLVQQLESSILPNGPTQHSLSSSINHSHKYSGPDNPPL